MLVESKKNREGGKRNLVLVLKWFLNAGDVSIQCHNFKVVYCFFDTLE